jgi:hypothetical protein
MTVKGNTIGKVVGETPSAPTPANRANPPLDPWDAVQMLLDLGGLIPGLGTVADLLNAAISAFRGDFIGMGLSLFSAIPGVGDAAGVAKITAKADKYLEAVKIVRDKLLDKLPDGLKQQMEEYLKKVERYLGADKAGEAAEKKAVNGKNGGGNNDKGNGKDNDGIQILGSGDEKCDIKPYGKQKCPSKQQAHHIVPDYVLRVGTRGDAVKNINRIPGMPSLNDGPSICLSGGSRVKRTKHNDAHSGTDKRISDAGKRSDGPDGTAPMGEIILISALAMAEVMPECYDKIMSAVKEAFKDVDPKVLGRTTEKLPKGRAVDALLRTRKRNF